MDAIYSSETPVISTGPYDLPSQNTILFIKIYGQRKCHKIDNGATYNKLYGVQ
jgi:hypothetical protein